MLERLVTIVVVSFPVSEIALALVKRSRAGAAASVDRGSMRFLWACLVIGVFLGIVAEQVASTRFTAPRPSVVAVALALLVVGLAVRWVAILTLGKLFTVDVAIHAGHAVVRSGPYRYMRHPSYTGLLIAFAGIGVYFGNGLSVVAILVPAVVGIMNRVVKEERALGESLGAAYVEYCARTKRFIPGVV